MPELGLSGPQSQYAQRNYRLSPLHNDGDAVAPGSFPPAGFGDGAASGGPFAQILQQLLSMLSQIMGVFSSLLAWGANNTSQTYFNSADAASVGDPHCSFNGATTNGTQTTHFDSMAPHADLLDSDSFFGGFQVSTQTTQPGPNGVTYNSSAAVTTNYGGTKVWLDKDEHAGISNNGQFTALQNGQTIDLGNGEVVTRAADGTLTVTETNANGGSIATTMRLNGQGVDVTAHAQNVDLGGDLVTGTTPPVRLQPQWV